MNTLPPRFEFISPANRPNYRQLVGGLAEASWPEFMLHDVVAEQNWDSLFERFSEYQFGLFDTETGRAAAMANSVPLAWDGDSADLPEEGWDWAFLSAVADDRAGLAPKTQCALQIAIHPDYRSQGLSAHMVKAMREIGQKKGFARLVAPVRPNLKSRYPLTPIENYIRWLDGDGLPFDPWLRVHVRLGGKIIRPCQRPMTVRGSLADWESWVGMKLPESGAYIVPGALQPLMVDSEQDEGLYVEPNVWTVHGLA